MSVLNIGDDISPFYSDPMQVGITIVHVDGDTYPNSTACGDKLTQLHRELQRLSFPYFFVELVTTNTDIKRELEILRRLYSTEDQIIKYKIRKGIFVKNVYKGDTMCVLPWIHKYTNPQGQVLTCCYGNELYPLGHLANTTLDSIDTKHIQDQMQRGERPDACARCYTDEDNKLESFREVSNRKFSHFRTQKEFVLRYVDFRFSNKCNLMCRMCSGKFSNRIAQEEEKLYGVNKYKNEQLTVDQIELQISYLEENIENIDSVYFAGGEPLIMQEHYRILEMLIKHNRTDVAISYNTNFSILRFKKYDLLDLWSKFNNITIGASIDLIGPQSNYVRHGVEYEILEKNYHIIKNKPNIRFKITSTLSLMNIFNLPHLQKHFIDLGLSCDNLNYSVLTNPDSQCITVLPEKYKVRAIEEIDDHILFLKTVSVDNHLINQWQETKTFMKSRSDSHLLSEFFRLNDDKDRMRNQKFEEYFPEFKDLRNYT
jgi:organic radical activating enzyme